MPLLGELAALATACFWSGGSIAFALATQRVGSVQVNVTRLILASFYLFLVVLLFRLDTNLSIHQILYLGASGVIGFALGDTFLFHAFQKLGARIAMLVMSLAPAVAAVLAYIILGEELSTLGVFGIAITIAGISIVVLERTDLNNRSSALHLTPIGVFYAVLAAIGQGSGLVVAKMAFREGDVNSFVATFVRIVAGLLLLLPVTVLLRAYRNPFVTFRRDMAAFRYTIYGSILGPFLGVAGSLLAIQYTKVGIAATIMATTPILMLPLVRIVHKERLEWRAFVGAIVATAGVAVLFAR